MDSRVGIVEMLVLNNQISKFRQGQEICLFSKMSRRTVDPTWPVQWVTATLSSGVKQLGHYADQLHPPSADVENDWSCVPACSICLHGMYRKNFTSASYISPLPLLFKALLHGQKDRVFFSGHLNLRTTPETGLPSRKKKS